MILRLFKSNAPVINFFYVLIGMLFWLNALLQPFNYQFFEGEDKGLLYAFIGRITAPYPMLQVILSLLIVLLISVFIQQIKISFALLKVRTKLPAIIFIVIVGGFTGMHTLHPVFFASVFLLMAIYSLFSVLNNPEPVTHLFNAGLFLCLGSLFYANLSVILFAFLFSIGFLRKEPAFKEYMVLLLGFVVPLLFAFSYAFFTDKLNELFMVYRNALLTPVNHFKGNYPLIGFASVVGLLTFIGSIKMVQLYDSSKVSTRKFYTVLFIIFIFSMISFSLVPASSQEMLIVSVIPVSFLIANLVTSINSVFWSEFLFTLLLLSAVFMQLTRFFVLNG